VHIFVVLGVWLAKILVNINGVCNRSLLFTSGPSFSNPANLTDDIGSQVVDVKISYKTIGHTTKSVDDFFEHLADIPVTLSYFPKLKPLIALDSQQYKWEFKRMGMGGIHHDLLFATEFSVDKGSGLIRFVALRGIGNATLSGLFTSTEDNKGTHCALEVKGVLKGFKVPRLLHVPAKTVIRKQFDAMASQFVENVMTAYG
jgi:hypothetical protein